MMPFLTVLMAFNDFTKQALAGYEANTKTVKVRHHRHRESTSAEWPCVSPRFISNDVSQLGQETTPIGTPELIMELAVNLVIDTELPAESDDDAVAGDDPTGYGVAAGILETVLDALFPEGETEPVTLGGVCWDIRYDGSAADEADASPDFARMEERFVLFYRVRADRPTELLMGS